MIDTNKRNTLKAIGAVTAAAVIPPGILHADSANTARSKIRSPHKGLGITELKVEIQTSTADRKHKVLLSNLTDRTVPVKHFAPGSVVWDKEYLDLNGLRGQTGLNLPAGSTIELAVHRQTRERVVQSDFIWADDAVSKVSTGLTSVLLGAFLADGQLHTYPIPAVNKSDAIAGVYS